MFWLRFLVGGSDRSTSKDRVRHSLIRSGIPAPSGLMSRVAKLVYFGSDAVCLPGLEFLAARQDCDLLAVVSQPDRRQGRGKKVQANPVAAWAAENEILLFQPEKPGRELAEWMSKQEIDLALVMAYGHFLPSSLRNAPHLGMVNFHGSLLPAYRGASPVESAIAEGATQTAVCLMQIVKEMDAGGVADCEQVPIGGSDTGPEVRAQVAAAVVPLLERNFESLLRGNLVFRAQQQEEATYCRKILKEDGAIDFSLPAGAVYNRFRAFNPWPGAYFDYKEQRIRVGAVEAEEETETGQLGGTVLSVSEAITVAVGKGVIRMMQLQRPGGRMLPAADFIRGFPIQTGEILKGGKASPLVSKEP